MNNRLAVVVLAHRRSGKTTTWNTLFGKTVRTGDHERPLRLCDGEWTDVFLVSGSFEETGKDITKVICEPLPTIVLCSVQYIEKGRKTIDFFRENGYSLVVQWLNPGYHEARQRDELGLVADLLSGGATVSVRDGRKPAGPRVRELREYILGWARTRGLTRTVRRLPI
jgi:hypothetical protein